MSRNRFRFLLSVLVMLFASAVSANVLINGNFESNAPTTNGNHLGWPVAPWVTGSSTGSSQLNVVQVDGPNFFNYGSAGPESDASAPGSNIPQHYLDGAGSKNEFYQTFTAACDGDVTVGGSFSTRDNLVGSAVLALRQGAGTSGTMLGFSNYSPLTGGNSKLDPWKQLSFTIPVTAGTTYTFVVAMSGNVNFDEAFVNYKNECAEACMEVKIKEALCDKPGTFTVTAQVVNHTGHTVHHVLVAPPPGATYSVSPNVIPVTLANGQSTGVTVTVTGAAPGQQICLTYLLQDAEGRTCCSLVVCVNLPECACLTITAPKVSCDPGPATYLYTFTVQNNTGGTIQQLFVIPSIGTVNPQLVPVNLAPGASTQVTLHLSGVSAGQNACFLLTTYGNDLKECCTVRVCVTLPLINVHCD